jgi:septal ring factor EnvC (AmiA/AmiB activator)
MINTEVIEVTSEEKLSEENSLLKKEIAFLRTHAENQRRDLEKAQAAVMRANHLEKALCLIHKWAEENSDEFLIDLIDLIE